MEINEIITEYWAYKAHQKYPEDIMKGLNYYLEKLMDECEMMNDESTESNTVKKGHLQDYKIIKYEK